MFQIEEQSVENSINVHTSVLCSAVWNTELSKEKWDWMADKKVDTREDHQN